ncbi:hypothetical protein ACLB1O_07810 [Escherichia coli]
MRNCKYAEFIGKEIQTAYLESYSEYGQNIFDRYVTYADFWIRGSGIIAIRIPGSCLTASLLTPSWRKSRNRRGSVIQKISATRLLTWCCAPEQK